MNLFENEYDGELNFEITDKQVTEEKITMDLSAEYNGQTVGLQVSVPLLRRKMLFKSATFLKAGSPVILSSLGEQSDRFLQALDEIWNPDFEVEHAFSEEPVELEYSLLNKDLYDCLTEKNYLKLFADIDLETGDDFDNINMEIGFNFNLGRNRASFVEKKKELRDDFAALIMA